MLRNLMAILKIARTQEGEHNVDDYIDGCGYIAIGGEIKEKRTELSSTLGEKQCQNNEIPIINEELMNILDSFS